MDLVAALRGPVALRTWLFAITAHKVRSLQRRRPRTAMPLPFVTGRRGGSRTRSTRERSAEGADLLEALNVALRELPPGPRSTWLLREVEGLSYDQIAEVVRHDDEHGPRPAPPGTGAPDPADGGVAMNGDAAPRAGRPDAARAHRRRLGRAARRRRRRGRPRLPPVRTRPRPPAGRRAAGWRRPSLVARVRDALADVPTPAPCGSPARPRPTTTWTGSPSRSSRSTARRWCRSPTRSAGVAATAVARDPRAWPTRRWTASASTSRSGRHGRPRACCEPAPARTRRPATRRTCRRRTHSCV